MDPLRGVRVLDLSRMLPVGLLGQMLADLGAEVIKVERPGTGEETRAFGARVAGTSAAHAFQDRGKKSIAVDLKDPHGLAVVHALAAEVDVVLESFRPGVAERLGVGYEDLKAINPRLVYCSVNGYGTGGPRELEPGHDMNYLAYSGALHFGGSRAHGPHPGGIQAADVIGGLTGGIGLLAALLAVRGGAEGTRVEVGLADAALWAVGLHVSSWAAGDRTDGPETTVVTGSAPAYRVYRCADGRYLSVAAIEPEFWAEFVRAIDRPDLVQRQHDPTAIEELAAVIAEQDLAHWTELLAGLETCVSPVQSFAEVLADEQFQTRGMFIGVPGAEDTVQVANPIRFSSPLSAPAPAAAVVGADTEAVLAGLDLPPEVVQAALAWAPADSTTKETQHV